MKIETCQTCGGLGLVGKKGQEQGCADCQTSGVVDTDAPATEAAAREAKAAESQASADMLLARRDSELATIAKRGKLNELRAVAASLNVTLTEALAKAAPVEKIDAHEVNPVVLEVQP